MLIRYSSNKDGKPVKKAIVYTKNEHCIKNEDIDPDALKVITQLRSFGFSSYLVGGAVRDLLLGKSPKDFDIVTDATPSKIKKLFRNSRIIGRRFRLVHVFFGSKIFEVSTFRSISTGTVGNSFGTMDEDVQRRDFTINALYYDPIKMQIIDYVGGLRDIKKQLINPVIPLDTIFVEDPVRMLRAVKYAASTGFKLPHSVKRKICKSAHLLSPVSPSRLTEELLKIINSSHAYDIVKLCLETDLYMYLQPGATSFMYEKVGFEKKYLDRLKQLDALQQINSEARLGQKLTYIIYDFIESLTNWKEEVSVSQSGELYTKTWSQCRNFVLPMNPQRTELEYAIRDVLRKLGVTMKIPKSAFSNKKKVNKHKVKRNDSDKLKTSSEGSSQDRQVVIA